MRMRSCQLVYLLLLLCSVQALDARAMAVLASGTVGAAAVAQHGSATEGRQARELEKAFACGTPRTFEPASPVSKLQDWPVAAGQAASVAVHTGFTRG